MSDGKIESTQSGFAQPAVVTGIDLDAYFRRIGYAGERTPTRDTLKGVHACHTETIPFENLNPLLGWPVRLDPTALGEKLIRDSRGGYCFEQNLLFSHMLRALGFQVTGLAARVLWNQPEGAITARGHMLLRVDLEDGPYIADVGFGGQTLTGPIRLQPDAEQSTPHESFRLLEAGDAFTLQSKIAGAWKTLYRFDLQEQFQVDYEVANYYMSTNPESHFVNTLSVARPAPGRRYALFNNQFTIHHLNGPTERHPLTSVPEIRHTLEGSFGLRLPAAPELDAVLARFL